MTWNVKGSLFADYVRMIRRRKDVDWSAHLNAADLAHVATTIDVDAWYPMATFERMGNAILEEIARGDLNMVRLWGRFSAGSLAEMHETLVAMDDPMVTLMRFKVLRGSFFDFPALDVISLRDDHAEIQVGYHMGNTAEKAACHQTLGFCEGLLALAGVADVAGSFSECSWAGDPRTVIELRWQPAAADDT